LIFEVFEKAANKKNISTRCPQNVPPVACYNFDRTLTDFENLVEVLMRK